jgi:hypothetical protein
VVKERRIASVRGAYIPLSFQVHDKRHESFDGLILDVKCGVDFAQHIPYRICDFRKQHALLKHRPGTDHERRGFWKEYSIFRRLFKFGIGRRGAEAPLHRGQLLFFLLDTSSSSPKFPNRAGQTRRHTCFGSLF